jgi:predicted GNAT family N-acyltransferase
MSASYVFEPLDQRHDRAAFGCGVEPLDRYLKQQAGQDMRKKVAVAYVLCETNSSTIIGYYTLSMSAVETTDLSEHLMPRLPRYPLLPAALIGRLAVDRRYRGQGHGARLLINALRRCLDASRTVAAIAVLVDAKDDAARQFYAHFGFMRFVHQEYKLHLPMKTIEALFSV